MGSDPGEQSTRGVGVSAGSAERRDGSRLLSPFVAAGLALVIGAAGVVGLVAIGRWFRESLTNDLRWQLESDGDALRNWVESQCRLARAVAAEPGIVAAAQPLAAMVGAANDVLRSAAPVGAFSAAAEAASRRAGADGFVLLDPAGRIVAASDRGAVGDRLPAREAARLGVVLDGDARVLWPPETGGETRPAARTGDPGAAVALAAAPIPGATPAALVFALRVPIDLKSTRAFAAARLGAAGEAIGSGVDVDGYRDARGNLVVGAWAWVRDLDLAVVHEVLVDDAHRGEARVKFAFWWLLAAAALAAALLGVGSLGAMRMRTAVRGARQLGQYTIVEKIGEGAMGAVYRASHAMLRRPTAVKLLETREPGAAERFEREVQLTSQLTHQNTIAIYDYGRTPAGVFYYAMELIDGIDLADLVRLEGPVAPGRVIHILRQVCGSLAEAHDQGLVHRDIKPSNIMITVRGGEPDFVKVLDFGLVKRVDRGHDPALTTVGVVFGTPGFIPPEVLRDSRRFDGRGDLYSLGAVAYELLCGGPLIQETTVEEMCRQAIEVVPPRPSARLGKRLPDDLEALVVTLLQKNPESRPAGARELRALLERCRDAGGWTEADARAWWARRGPEIVARRQARRKGGQAPGGAIPVDPTSRGERTLEPDGSFS